MNLVGDGGHVVGCMWHWPLCSALHVGYLCCKGSFTLAGGICITLGMDAGSTVLGGGLATLRDGLSTLGDDLSTLGDGVAGVAGSMFGCGCMAHLQMVANC